MDVSVEPHALKVVTVRVASTLALAHKRTHCIVERIPVVVSASPDGGVKDARKNVNTAGVKGARINAFVKMEVRSHCCLLETIDESIVRAGVSTWHLVLTRPS